MDDERFEDDEELQVMAKCREFINKNLSRLIELTKLDPLTLAKFNDIMGKGDMAAVECQINPHKKNAEFYGRIVSCLGFHNVLIEVFEESKQTEVVKILKKFNEARKAETRSYRKVPKALQEFLEDDKSKVCILHTLDNAITCKKIEENLKNCCINDEEKFLQRISSRSSLRKDVVHIVRDSTVKNMRQIMMNLNHESISKLLLINSENKEKLTDFVRRNHSWGSKVDIRWDAMEWEDLSLAKQLDITEKLEESFGIVLEEDELTQLRGQLIVDMINGNEVKLFKNTLPEELSYYVDRKVLSRCFVSSETFKLGFSAVFLFTGMKRNELSRFVENQTTDGSRKQIHLQKLSVRHMILDHPNHFDKICEKTNEPVHWFQYEGGRLRWIKSRGCLAEVQKCIDQNQVAEGEEEFCLNLKASRPVCISDSPGMGKSVLLAQIGRRLAKKYPDRIVAFVVLSEYIKNVKMSRESNTLEAIKSVLKSTVCENIVGEKIFISKLVESSTSEENICVELLLDGLDEVDSTDSKLSFKIMKTIRTSFKSARLWVTSRPHLMEELENNLNQLGYNIQPFCENDQVQFLTSFWSQNAPLDQVRIDKFARTCLISLKTKMNSKDQDIAGIPLQCMLIGEVYKDDAVEYADLDIEMALHIEISTITNLYQRLIAKKFEKYLTTYSDSDSTSKLTEQMAMNMLVKLSLELIFPEQFSKLENLFVKVEIGELFKIGILESSNEANIPRFVHRTFAEYFVGWFLAESLKRDNCWREELTSFFFNGALRCEKKSGDLGFAEFYFAFFHNITTYFLNAFLGDDLTSIDTIQIANHLTKHDSVSEEILQQIAEACAFSDFLNIFIFFDKIKAFEPYIGNIFSKEFLIHTVQISFVEVVRLSLAHFEEHHNFDPDFQAQLLHAAVQRGNFYIVEFLMKEKGLRSIVEELSGNTAGLLHTCVAETGIKSEDDVEQIMEIVGTLVEINRGLLENRDGPNRTPLLTYCVHRKVLIQLIGLRANIMARDDEDMTVVHLVEEREHISKEDYHSILVSIPKERLKQMVGVNPEWTPLKILIFHRFDPVEESLEMLKAAGEDFNCVFQDGYSLMAMTIRMGRSTGTLRKLIEGGAKLSWKGEEKGENLLHIAAEFGRLEAVTLLVEEYGMNVNVEDNVGHTPLTYALQSDFNEGSRFETGLFLFEKGAEFKEMAGPGGQSLLHVAAKEGNVDSIRILLNLGANTVNDPDHEGNTALHLGTDVGEDKDYFAIASILIDNKADPNALNKLGETPFERALENRRLDFETFQLLKYKTDERRIRLCSTPTLKSVLRMSEDMDGDDFGSLFQDCLDLGADLKYQDDKGNSLLHLTANNGLIRALCAIISKNVVDVNLPNCRNETALHKAARARFSMKADHDVDLKIIKYLIEHGVDVNVKDVEGQTFLHHYMSSGLYSSLKFHPIIEYLLEMGYTHLFEDVGGKYQATPIQLAICSLATDEILRQGRSEFLSDLESRYGMDWRKPNVRKRSMLHISAQSHFNYLQRFLDLEGLDVNAVDEDGDTPLHSVLQGVENSSLFEKCQLLIEKRADVNIMNKQGLTPFKMAMQTYNESDKNELLRLLAGLPSIRLSEALSSFRGRKLS